jgi:hypothetical protein
MILNILVAELTAELDNPFLEVIAELVRKVPEFPSMNRADN